VGARIRGGEIKGRGKTRVGNEKASGIGARKSRMRVRKTDKMKYRNKEENVLCRRKQRQMMRHQISSKQKPRGLAPQKVELYYSARNENNTDVVKEQKRNQIGKS
jgi:hypothetical protein